MADCFTMPNAAELAKQLKGRSACVEFYDNCNNCAVEFKTSCRTQQEMNRQAADTIEALLAENAKLKAECEKCGEKTRDVIIELQSKIAKLKAERDAAVADLRYSPACHTCKYGDGSNVCGDCVYYSEWRWRGVQKEEEE